MKLSLAISLFAVGCSSVTSEGADQGELNAKTAGVCSNLAVGPFSPALYGQPFNGSEDFAFDGHGAMIGKKGNQVVKVDASGTTPIAALPGQTYGLRYAPNGNLIAAIPGSGKLMSITPSGQVTERLEGLGQPNGVFVDFDGSTYITEFSGNKVTKLAADGTRSTLASGTQLAQAANGIAIDQNKHVLYYSEYSKGNLRSIALDQANPTPKLVATIRGAALDGMVLDACGNIYAVDQGSSRIFRVKIGADGAATGDAELLATFPQNVANAQFGSGAGFDPNTLYVTGNPGSVYALSLGVGGMPVPTAP